MITKLCPKCKIKFKTYSKKQNHCSRQCAKVPVHERFWAKVDKKTGDECWPWVGGISKSGYGIFYREKKSNNAHRVAWELTHGNIKTKLSVCHTCDNPICCNVNHLFLGTASDNAKDMAAKGRHPWLKKYGENHHMSKLTDNDVREIRKLHESGRFSQRQISTKYGVGRTTIQQIVEFRSWRHVL